MAAGLPSTDDADAFTRLVTLACHDLRTPLATILGFSQTIARNDALDETTLRYAGMVESAARQLGELLVELGLAARIESGRFEPRSEPVETTELAHAAAVRLGPERVGVSGQGGTVRVERDATRRAFSSLVQCALRHGGLEHVDVEVAGAELRLSPITKASAPVVLGTDLRDLGAAVGVLVIVAHGGSVSLDGETLTVRLPAA